MGMKHHCYAALGILLFLVPLGVHAQAVISEVLWMGSDQSISDEWLELARVPCASAADCAPVDLSGWSIASLNSAGVEVTIVTLPVGTMLTIEQPLVVARTAAATSRLEQEPGLVASILSLPNTKLLLKLVNAAGTIVDEVDDGVGAPFAGANPSGGTKASMERIDLAVAGTLKENWRTAMESRGFDAVAAMLGTPGWFAYPNLPENPPPSDPPPESGSGSTVPPDEDEETSSGSGGTTEDSAPSPPPAHVLLNAVLPNPTGKDELGEWIELKNLSGVPALLNGWVLVGEGGSTKTFPLDGRVIDASSTLRLTFAETQLSLTNSKFRVTMLNDRGAEVSSVNWENAAEQRVYRPNLYSDLTLHGTVSRVIDGDTLEVVFDQESTPDGRSVAIVRLIGIDAPESVHPTKKPEPYGIESSNLLRWLLEKKKVELQFDTINWDVYDRMLAYVTVDEQVLAQERLLSTGLAKVYPDYAFTRRGLFDAYELQAKVLHVGMWGVPASTPEYKAPAAFTVSTAVVDDTIVLAVPSDAIPAAGPTVFSAAWSDVRISEVYAHVRKNDASPLLATEWIEVWNASHAPLNLKGWKIRIGEGEGAKSVAVGFAQTVGANALVVLSGSGETFKLRDSGNAIALVAPDGTVTSTTAYPALKVGQSWVVDDACVASEPTPGLENRCATQAASENVASVAAKVSKAMTTSSSPKLKKSSVKKTPSPEFVLAQQSLSALQSRTDASLSLGDSGSAAGFWQAFTFFLAAVSLCQGVLVALVAWKSGLLSGGRKIALQHS